MNLVGPLGDNKTVSKEEGNRYNQVPYLTWDIIMESNNKKVREPWITHLNPRNKNLISQTPKSILVITPEGHNQSLSSEKNDLLIGRGCVIGQRVF